MKNGLTQASTRTLWRISYPLMLSFLSTFAMAFVDRAFLANYSANSLQASVAAGSFAWSLIVAMENFASYPEVIVAQYNGANRKSQLAHPTWQAIWLSIFCTSFFVIAYFLGGAIYSGEKRAYFQGVLWAGPFAMLSYAVGTYYMGQGRSYVITWLCVIGNLVNVILDPIFIFTLDMGAAGAALATTIGFIAQFGVGMFLFLLPKPNRDATFRWPLFKQCVKLGSPPAIFSGLEVLAWAVFFVMMERTSPQHIFVASICQSIELFFLYHCFGLEKGCAAMVGNMIGANKLDQIEPLTRKAYRLIAIFAVTTILLLIVFPEPIIHLFTKDREISLIRTALVFITCSLIIENARWLYSGVLLAAQDTLFLMVSGVISIWLFMIVPTYYLVVVKGMGILTTFAVWVGYSILSSLMNYLRFKSGAFQAKIGAVNYLRN